MDVAPKGENVVVHRLKNDLAVIVGFCDLVLGDLPVDDPRRPDLIEIQKAAKDASDAMPEISRLIHAAAQGNPA